METVCVCVCVCVCVVSSLLLCHPALGRERKVRTAVYGSSCWGGRGGWLDADWPGRAALIKGLKLINLWFRMVGFLRSLSLSYFFPSHTFQSFSLSSNWCACNCGCSFFGHSFDHWLWFHSPDSSRLTTASFHLLHMSPSVSSPLLFFLPLVSCSSSLASLPPHPACEARLYPYRWVQSSEAEGKRGRVITLHSLSPVSAPLQRHWSVENLELNGVSIGSMRKLLFSIARGPFI